MEEEIHLEKFNKICETAVSNFQTTQELSPRTREELSTIYGCPEMHVKSPEEIRPPSPTESITNTMNYLDKLKNKGFLQGEEVEKFNEGLLQQKIYEYNAKKVENDNNKTRSETDKFDALISGDPQIKAFLDTDTVKSLINDITGFPFKEGIYTYQTINKFYYEVTSHVRKLKTQEKKRKRAKSGLELKKEMYDFVTFAMATRRQLLADAILEKKVETEKLSKSLRKEFKVELEKIEPKVTAEKPKYVYQGEKKASETDRVLVGHAKDLMDKFPANYIMKDDTFVDKNLKQMEKSMKNGIDTLEGISMDAVLSSKSSQSSDSIIPEKKKRPESMFLRKPPRILGLIKPKPQIVVPKVEKKVVEKPKKTAIDYWVENDPLNDKRSGKPIDVFKQFKELVKIDENLLVNNSEPDVSFPHLIIDDYKPSTAVVVDNKDTNITEDMWSTAQMSNLTIPKKKENKSKQNANSDVHTLNGFTADQLMGTATEMRRSEAFTYLMKHIPVDDGPPNATATHIKTLQGYMEKLGYTMYQKLEIFKKYSLNTELMSKIQDYLPFWEHSVDCFTEFKKTYGDLKLLLETCLTISNSDSQYSALKTNFGMLVVSLQESGDRLKALTDDVLYLNGKSYLNYIDNKKDKIEKLQKQKVKD